MFARKVICFCTPLNTERIGGILRYAREQGWNIILSATEDERFLGWGADGVLATLRDNSAGECLQRIFTSRHTPLVDLTVERPDLDLPRVVCDHEAIGRIASQHLLERGFSDFAWFSTGWSNVHALRYRGFSPDGAALKWIAHKGKRSHILSKTSTWTKFLKWIGPLLASARKPLGVLAYDETDASRILSACHELGVSVPEQISVIACGNEPLFSDYQPITISGVDSNLDAQGYEAARLLDRIMSGKRTTPNGNRLIPPRGIVLRQSTDIYTSSDPVVQAALKFISQNLARPIGAREVAEALGLPRYRLDRLFSAKQKTSVGHEISRQRLMRAKQLVEKSTLSIEAIAKSCGYCNPGYLVNRFHRAFGVSPGSYRKSLSLT